jgi:TrmH family RNA methyltransferase
MKELISKDNPIVKEIARLKQKKYRDLAGMYVLEGRNLVGEVLNSGQPPVYLLIQQERLEQYQDLIARNTDLPWYATDARVMKQLSDTESPQGILAVMPKPVYNLEKLAKPGGLLVVLDQVSDPGNMGTIIRTCWAFGVDAVLLTKGSADPFNPKVVRSSMGGILKVPVLEDVTPDKLEELKVKGYRLMATGADKAVPVYEADLNGSVAVVIGSEARGLSPRVAARCDATVTIPCQPEVDSLNAAVACGIILGHSWHCRFYRDSFV